MTVESYFVGLTTKVLNSNVPKNKMHLIFGFKNVDVPGDTRTTNVQPGTGGRTTVGVGAWCADEDESGRVEEGTKEGQRPRKERRRGKNDTSGDRGSGEKRPEGKKVSRTVVDDERYDTLSEEIIQKLNDGRKFTLKASSSLEKTNEFTF